MAYRLALEQITALGLPPAELIDLAASLKCEAISLFVEAPVPELISVPFVTDAALRRDVRTRLCDSGVRVHTIECFAIGSDTVVRDFAPALAAGAELGGVAATVVVFDTERQRAVNAVGELVQLAASFGMAANVEFLAQSALPSLAAAIALVRDVEAPGLGIVVDSLHWTRSGGTAAELRAIDPGLVGAIQICDGPREMPAELQLSYEGLLQRQIPGSGAFALDAFVGALPPSRLIGVEVPLKDLADQGVPVAERARRAVQGTREVLAKFGYPG